MHNNIAVIIPARLASTRLCNKMLEKIGDRTLIEHVIKKVQLSSFENIFVATDSEIIATIAANAGAEFVITDPNCPSGTDRTYQALTKIDSAGSKFDFIINVQGDMPFINGQVLNDIAQNLEKRIYDIITPVVRVNHEVASNPSNVKVVIDYKQKALYFSRSLIPYGGDEFLYHVGIYGFSKEAIKKFVSFSQTNYEKCEKLEQLRAIEQGLTIGICYSNEVPISVDTIEDLEKARSYYNSLKIERGNQVG